MKLITRDKSGLKDWFFPFFYEKNEDFFQNINDSSALKIILLREGSGIVTINNIRRSILSPAIMILNEKDNLIIENLDNLKASTIYFHPIVIDNKIDYRKFVTPGDSLSKAEIEHMEMLKPFVSGSAYREIDPKTFFHIKEIFEIVEEQLVTQPGDYWVCRSRSYLFELLLIIDQLFENHKGINEDLTSLNSDIANDILVYLYNNISNKITINDICKSFGLNKNLVQQYMQTATGYTAMTYLSKLRIQVASIFLRDTAVPVNEISRRCGFDDPTNFGRTFKRSIGLTPSEYRSDSQGRCAI